MSIRMFGRGDGRRYSCFKVKPRERSQFKDKFTHSPTCATASSAEVWSLVSPLEILKPWQPFSNTCNSKGTLQAR